MSKNKKENDLPLSPEFQKQRKNRKTKLAISCFVLLLAVERIIIYVVNRYMPFLMGRKQKRGIKI